MVRSQFLIYNLQFSMNTTIVLPVHNEEDRVLQVLKDLSKTKLILWWWMMGRRIARDLRLKIQDLRI